MLGPWGSAPQGTKVSPEPGSGFGVQPQKVWENRPWAEPAPTHPRAPGRGDCRLLGECSPKCRNLFVLETVCVAWFSFEFLLRSLQAESKCAFLRTPLNIIDILAILPFYVSLLVGLAARPGAGGNKLLERAGLVLRLLRALRVLYVMRLARHSLGLRSLGLTVRRCAREFGLLLLFLCVAMALFAPLVHLAERELGARRDFSSVPASYWWAVISMTTVGYGDMVPRSLPGQVVALSSILSGILLMAFPVTSIFHTFSRSYSELKEQQQRAASPEPALREDSTRSASASATATEDDGSPSPDACMLLDARTPELGPGLTRPDSGVKAILCLDNAAGLHVSRGPHGLPGRLAPSPGVQLLEAVALRAPRSPAELKPLRVTGRVLWAVLQRTVWERGHAAALHPGEPPTLAVLLLPASLL
nr:PREDICTED: potassium voltage-gated channel subfamily G member 2 [Bos mutus]